MPQNAPRHGFFTWLGRQVAFVKKAIDANPGPKTVYREEKTEEKTLPGHPNVKLRRTVIDEVIEQRDKEQRSS